MQVHPARVTARVRLLLVHVMTLRAGYPVRLSCPYLFMVKSGPAPDTRPREGGELGRREGGDGGGSRAASHF